MSKTMTLSEFAKSIFGTTVVKKKDLGEQLFLRTNLNKFPAGSLRPCQRTDKRGYYDTTWSADNPDPEPVIVLKGTDQKEAADVATESASSDNSATTARVVPQQNLVPAPMAGFVATANYTTIRNVIQSGAFFPVYITGDTGCGKTLMVRQACSAEKREFVRVNLTEQSGEAHLIGSYKLVDGETVWVDGPAITAMRRGAILLLDEVDLGSAKMMCLQPILEGSPYFIERTGELVTPAPGFNILATANTKGRMDSSSRKFVNVRNQNEAFLDRFSMTLEQPYPTEKQERRILDAVATQVAASVGTQVSDADKKFLDVCFTWVRAIREAYVGGSYENHISTRRAKDVIRGYFILNRKVKVAVEGAVSRFDEVTKDAFLRLFNTMNDDDIDWSFLDSDNDKEVPTEQSF